MKQIFSLVLALSMLLVLAACGAAAGQSAPASDASGTAQEASNAAAPEAPSGTPSEPEAPEGGDAESAGLKQGQEDGAQGARQIEVRFDGGTVVYQLNDSAAADALLTQLPLTVELEDYSTNEKIFYPPQALDTSGAPLAEGGAGVLAYYAPWGDVVLFYDSFGRNSSLYALGQVVSGGELVGELSGTVTIAPVES